MSLSGRTRRRGAALEEAILDAAWAQLVEFGYARFTIEAVAERAGTSRPVLYRRWATRSDLLLAAIRQIGERTRPGLPDTGNFRDDLLAYLRAANQSRLGMAAVVSAQIGTFYEESGATPAELRRLVIGDRPYRMDTIVARAVERGEAPADLPQRVRNLPFDLLRGEALLNMRPAPDESIVAIVDDVFLPLVRDYLRVNARAVSTARAAATSAAGPLARAKKPSKSSDV